MANSEEVVKRIAELEEHFFAWLTVTSCWRHTTLLMLDFQPYLQFETQSLKATQSPRKNPKHPSHPSHIPKNFPSSFKKPPRPCTWSGRLASLGTMEWWCYSSNFCKLRFVYSTCTMHDRAKNRFVVLFFRHGGMDGGWQVGKVGKLVVWVRDGWVGVTSFVARFGMGETSLKKRVLNNSVYM